MAPISLPSAPRALLVLWLPLPDHSLVSRWAPAARSQHLEFWSVVDVSGLLSTLRCADPLPAWARLSPGWNMFRARLSILGSDLELRRFDVRDRFGVSFVLAGAL